MQLFTKRAPEMVNTLKTLLHLLLNNETEDYDLKDRATYYCKLLQSNFKELKDLMERKIDMKQIFIEDEELFQVDFNLFIS